MFFVTNQCQASSQINITTILSDNSVIVTVFFKTLCIVQVTKDIGIVKSSYLTMYMRRSFYNYPKGVQPLGGNRHTYAGIRKFEGAI
ncbi:MAG: hypothetical protein A2Y23_14825 [Clostridiales bacterium GWB2_37_7]|nr:MAG: hypothetical protein A2Y23_14825 [Clostridiales bacterium GWB2_37_7]